VFSRGTRLGRYEIRSRLGAGGMGEVYLAHDTRLDRKVALKVLPAALATDADRMRRFEHEAKAASGLNHPNIITIYEIDQSGPTSFIATEFIDGSTLRERMQGQPMPLEDILDVAIQIAGALVAAHTSGIVHRDIKPENVIVRSDGIVKVLDFGVAKSVQGSPDWVDAEAPTRADLKTESGLVMGTATYMSPEQARGQQVDARTDTFSLGVVLYEMLTGRVPFGGSNLYEMIAAILSDREPSPVSRYSPEIPGELERIVAKALRKNREERYQTVKDLLLDLQNLKQRLEFERAHGARLATGDEPVRNVGSPLHLIRSRVLGVLGLLVVFAAAAIGYASWKRTQAAGQLPIKSLAVLPLKSLDGGDNYLGLGIADAAIRRVSQTGTIIVRPTSAVRRYLNEDTDALAAAKQLGVDSVLEGSFQHGNDRLRVSVNLLRCQDGKSLWSDSFDIRMADIFAVQDTVAQQVASRLRLPLDSSQQAQLTKRYTSDPIAYEFYLKGLYNFDQRMRDPKKMTDNAIGFFKKAIDADPNFALAHAQLAYTYATVATFLDPTHPTVLEQANQEIVRAQELDPQLAETHLARFQLLYSEFEGYQAEAAAREALLASELNPNVGHFELSYMFSHLGLEDLAERELARGLKIDPTSDALKATSLLIYEVQSKYDEYAADRTVRRDAKSEAWYFMGKGRLADAQKAIDQWPKTEGNSRQLPATQALLFALRGDFRAAEAQVPLVLANHPQKDPLYHHDAYDIACVYALEGNNAKAVKWLRESAVWGFHLYPRYVRDPFLDRIRQSPEFTQFLAEMKAENDRYRREFSQDAVAKRGPES
jgi:eukaryotic-like serine/threonine-protein kinase